MQEKFAGIWPGIVIDTKDPSRRSMIKVRTPQFGSKDSVYKIPDIDLPWATPCFPMVGENSGMVMIPEVGSGVWVMFFGCDPKNPVWLGGYYGVGDRINEHDHSNAGSPSNYLIKTPNGNIFELSDALSSSGIYLIDDKGQEISMDSATLASKFYFTGQHTYTVLGKRTMSVAGANAEEVTGDDTKSVEGAMTQTVTGAWTVTSLSSTLLSLAAITLGAIGAITITAAAAVTLVGLTVNIVSTAVVLGTVANALKLCNKNFMDLYNSHTHLYVKPATPGGTTDTGVPTQQGIEDTHTTKDVRAS